MKHSELIETAKLVSSDNKEDIAKALSVAASIEAEGIKFYSHWAEKAKNRETQKFFRFLVSQEEGHLAAINALKASVESTGKWSIGELPDSDYKVFARKDWDKEEEQALTAILFALWKEREAREFYLEAAANAKDRNAKKFFEALAEFEQDHADLLGEYIDESFYSHELIMG